MIAKIKYMYLIEFTRDLQAGGTEYSYVKRKSWPLLLLNCLSTPNQPSATRLIHKKMS